jgi:hypothetical protein
MRRRAGDNVGEQHEEQVDPVDRELGDECEAFLRGKYLPWLLAEGLPVPGWAWLNRAAHASYEEIGRHVHELGVPEQPCCYPHAALLIEGILVIDVQPSHLAEVQRTVVVPLELEMIAQTLSPRAAMDRVARALHRA